MKTLVKGCFFVYQHLEDQINCSCSTAVFCCIETIKITPKIELEKELKVLMDACFLGNK